MAASADITLSKGLPSVESHSGPSVETRGATDKFKPLEPAASLESEGAPSVDDTLSLGSNEGSDSGVSGFTGQSTTASLRSSIYEHVEEYGRTYHGYKEGKYMLPNDEVCNLIGAASIFQSFSKSVLNDKRVPSKSKIDWIQHALFGVTLHGELYLAPIGDNPKHVLDIGTGTGVWAIEFAIQHPSSDVLGTDLSAIQPQFVPPNCRFQVEDAEDDWVFSQKFDFIHGRALLSCFGSPAAVIRQAFDALAPGGYLEMQDAVFPMKYIGEPPVNSDLYKWNALALEGARKSGRAWDNTIHYAHWMRETGFEDVVERDFYWPTSTWAKGEHLKQVATYFQADMLNGLEGLSLKILTRFMGWSADEVKAFLVGVKRDMKDRSIHAYLSIKVVYGRKPLGAM